MLKLNLVTPAKKLITELQVEEVYVPAERGELNILSGHAALMSTLTTGVLRYRKTDESDLQQVAISWGYLEVSNNVVTVLAETAETPAEIDLERAKEAQNSAEKHLLKPEMSPDEIQKAQLKLERSIIRQQVASGVRADR